MIQLRPYQEQALAARAEAERDRPAENRQLIVMATGLGKTITFGAEAAREPGRTLILVHTDELAEQAETKVKLMAPGRVVGVVKAARNDVDAEIIIGSVQTLVRTDRIEPIGQVDRLVIDEAHHAVAHSYKGIIRHVTGSALFTEMFGPSQVPVTGYTATPRRADGTSLGSVWHDVAFSRGIAWAVRQGFLVDPVGYTIRVPQLGQVAAGSDAVVDRALVDSIAPEAVVDAWLSRATDAQMGPSYEPPSFHPSTVLFAPLVASARAFADAFQAAGVSAAVVWGDMPAEERKLTLKRYAFGDIAVLCNAMMLTEGWDVPRTKCVVWARPTPAGSPLFIQGAGRGLRPWLDGPIPRAEQRCALMVLADASPSLASVADLSDHPGLTAKDGQSLTELEGEYNLNDLGPDAPNAYAGALDVERFDPLVAASDKVWSRTKGGALFVPAGRDGYVAILPGYAVAYCGRRGGGEYLARDVPDVELAMALAEDAAIDRGGDMGRLLADKTRPWRRGVPSDEAKARAVRMGLDKDLERILATRAAGKAGRLSDLMDRVQASRVIDPVVEKINGRTGR